MDALGWCAASVRRHDPDRYFAALFAPPAARAALLALYAFNLEVARVRETVSEPLIGQIRLQWWREALDEVYGDRPVRRHAVVRVLADAIGRHGLDRADFEQMIDAREFDLEDRQPDTLDALAGYGAATAGTLAALATGALDAGTAGADAPREAGTAWALAGLLRAVPFHARQRRCYLPRDVLADDQAVRALYDGRIEPAVAEAMAAVAARAHAHLTIARRRGVSRTVLPAVLPATLIESDLGRLAGAGSDLFVRSNGPPLARQARMLWAAARGRI